MADIYETRQRITGLNKIQNMTYSMQIITISRLKRMIQRSTSVKTIRTELARVSHLLSLQYPSLAQQFHPDAAGVSVDKTAPPVLLLVLSNRGFCGYFNHEIIQKGISWATANGWKFEDLPRILIGKKGSIFLKNPELKGAQHLVPEKDVFQFSDVRLFLETLAPYMAQGRRIMVAYHQFHSIMKQDMLVKQWFPLDSTDVPAADSLPNRPHFFEPDPETVAKQVMEQWYATDLLNILLDSSCSEFSQRFLIMKNAVDNVKELTETLTLDLNKERQRIITQELSEIISSSKALSRSRS